MFDRTGIERAPCVVASTAIAYLAAVALAMAVHWTDVAAMTFINAVGAAVLAGGAWVTFGPDDETLSGRAAVIDAKLALIRRSTGLNHQQQP